MTVAIAQSRIIIWNYRMFCYIYVNYLIFSKKYNEALQTMLSLGKSINSETPSSDCEYYHATIKEIYLNLGDYKNAYHHSEKEKYYARTNLNDSTMSVLADAKAEQAVMIEKIERENDAKLHAEKSRRHITIIISLISAIILVAVIVIIILKALIAKKKSNELLSEKNEILNSQKAEIMTQRDERVFIKSTLTTDSTGRELQDGRAFPDPEPTCRKRRHDLHLFRRHTRPVWRHRTAQISTAKPTVAPCRNVPTANQSTINNPRQRPPCMAWRHSPSGRHNPRRNTGE